MHEIAVSTVEIAEDVGMAENEKETGTSTQTDITIDELNTLFEQLDLISEEDEKLKKKISHFSLTEEAFVGDDKKKSTLQD